MLKYIYIYRYKGRTEDHPKSLRYDPIILICRKSDKINSYIIRLLIILHVVSSLNTTHQAKAYLSNASN